ncbi:MAG: dTMP kinase [Caldilineaceae bacterium]|nr:dTMP kinase [Caldilineaceae bacterium]
MFITFEGPEGGGKTTQIQLLQETLVRQGYAVLATREPGGTQIGNAIRTVLLDAANSAMSERAEALLFNAARAQLVDEVIRPALERGQIVLCDRYADSTLAYQGYGRELDLDKLKALIHFATAGLQPDLTIYLAVDPATGIERKRQLAGVEWNRLEEEDLAFHQRVTAGFQQLINAAPERWLAVDATRPIQEVHRMIRAGVMQRMPQQTFLARTDMQQREQMP